MIFATVLCSTAERCALRAVPIAEIVRFGAGATMPGMGEKIVKKFDNFCIMGYNEAVRKRALIHNSEKDRVMICGKEKYRLL